MFFVQCHYGAESYAGLGNSRTPSFRNHQIPNIIPSRRVLWSVLKTLASTGLCANWLIIRLSRSDPVRPILFRSYFSFPHSFIIPSTSTSTRQRVYPPDPSPGTFIHLRAVSPSHLVRTHAITQRRQFPTPFPYPPFRNARLPAIAAPVSSGSIARYGKLSALLRYFTG